ncbi:MAG: ATPase domain-containing protein [Candidatus Micrarchaeota archaeon]
MERKFVKSGIPGLDRVLGGGFLEGSITTIGGATGCGKSTFAMQFLYNGATKHNEPGLYIAIEESRDDMLFHMSGYIWDIRNAEQEKKILFLDYPVYEVSQFMDQYGAIQEIINSAGVKRAVVDSVMPVALFFPSEDERKKGFLKLIDNIRKWGTTTLIVSEDTKPQGKEVLPNTTYEIESFTDGWINLAYQYDEKKDERVRYVEVLKMKGVKHLSKPFPADIDDEGFMVHSGIAPAPSPKPAAKTPVASAPKKPAESQAKSALVRKVVRKTLGIRKR